jgi:hypothetical protein
MLDRIGEEEKSLLPTERAWWEEHRIPPEEVQCGADTRYAVAAVGDQRVLFFDDEDEFGTARVATDGTATELWLLGDLQDAVLSLAARVAGKPRRGSLAELNIKNGRTWDIKLAATGEHLFFVVADTSEQASAIAKWTTARTCHESAELIIVKVNQP